MTTASVEYKTLGIQRIVSYKSSFVPSSTKDENAITKFVNLFCEYQLADNNYTNIQFEATLQKDNDTWFDTLSIDQVLQFITYIIWTDKFIAGYLQSKIKDNTVFRLLKRAEDICKG